MSESARRRHNVPVPWPWRLTATLLPMIGVVLTILLFHMYIVPHVAISWQYPLLTLMLVIGTGLFSYVVFGILSQQQTAILSANERLEKQRDGLNALREASYAMTTVGDWTDIVQNVVDVACRGLDLVGDFCNYDGLFALCDNPSREILMSSTRMGRSW